MLESIHKITTIDGHVISLHIFSPSQLDFQQRSSQSNCNGAVLALHGLGEHMARYKHVAEFTCKKNKIFAAFNVRGHGDDGGKRGDVQNFASLILDIISAFKTLKKLFPNIDQDSFALFGHSFGGLQMTFAASVLQQEVKQIFLSAPGYAPKIKIPAWKTFLANNAAYLFPRLSIPLGEFADKLSNNPATNAQYKKDQLRLTKVSARFGKIILDAFHEGHLKSAIQNVSAEVTIIVPPDDQIIDPNFTKEVCSLFPTPAHVLEIEGCGHEALNETENIQQIAFSYYEKWLEKI